MKLWKVHKKGHMRSAWWQVAGRPFVLGRDGHANSGWWILALVPDHQHWLHSIGLGATRFPTRRAAVEALALALPEHNGV